MLFQRLFLCALLVGTCSGLVHGAIQRWQVIPLIEAAEVFETQAEPVEPAHDDAHGHDHEHTHDAAAWEPEDGLERTAWTVVANVLSGTGYALLLLPLIAAWDRRNGGRSASWRSGALWGAAGWLCLFAVPALGLPPELPGSAAAALQARQAWWLMAALSTAAGLGLLCWRRERMQAWRWLGLALPLLPFAIGAPRHEGPLFPGHDAQAVVQLQALSEQFFMATSAATAVYWVVLGALCGAVTARWVRPLFGQAPSPTPMAAMESR